MKIGINLNHDSIDAVLLENNSIIRIINEPLCPSVAKKTIMEKTLCMIEELMHQDVTGIGLSLPSLINPQKGIVYDLMRIPHWKGIRIKEIINKAFRKPVFLNTDMNCVVLGEQHYGVGQNHPDIVCIYFDKNIGTGGTIHNKLCIYSDNSPDSLTCLSQYSYRTIRKYTESYLRAIDELQYFAQTYPNELEDPDHEIWENIGVITGRLVAILYNNYLPKVIVLGGCLSRSFDSVIVSVKEYLNRFHPGNSIGNLIVPGSNNCIKALGAITLISSNKERA